MKGRHSKSKLGRFFCHCFLLALIPGTLFGQDAQAIHSLRTGMQTLVRADTEMAKLKQIYELYRQVHAVNEIGRAHV